MGLDTVEIVLEIEKAFGIKMPDKELEQVVTVGQLQDLVWKYIQHRPNAHCKSQQLFYRLRNLFQDHYELRKNGVQLQSDPNGIFPAKNRRQHYAHFQNVSGLRLPPLVLGAPHDFILFLFGILAIAGSFVLAFVLTKFYHYSNWLYMLSVIGIILTHFIYRILNPWRTVIPAKDLRTFTFKVLSLNYPEIENKKGNLKADADEVVRTIIIDKSGADLEEVVPDAKIGDDLGID